MVTTEKNENSWHKIHENLDKVHGPGNPGDM